MELLNILFVYDIKKVKNAIFHYNVIFLLFVSFYKLKTMSQFCNMSFFVAF